MDRMRGGWKAQTIVAKQILHFHQPSWGWIDSKGHCKWKREKGQFNSYFETTWVETDTNQWLLFFEYYEFKNNFMKPFQFLKQNIGIKT